MAWPRPHSRGDVQMATFRVQLCLGQLRPWDSAPAAVEWGQCSIRQGFRVGPEASMQCEAGELGCRPSSWSVFRAQCHECKACPWLFGWGTLRKRRPAPQRGLGSLRPQARGSLLPGPRIRTAHLAMEFVAEMDTS